MAWLNSLVSRAGNAEPLMLRVQKCTDRHSWLDDIASIAGQAGTSGGFTKRLVPRYFATVQHFCEQ